MTEQELREKIKNIILEKVIAEPLDASMAIEIADALIDVGIGDVSDIKAESNKYEILYRLQNKDMAIAFVMTNKYKTRAEAAERDLQAWKDCAQKWQKYFHKEQTKKEFRNKIAKEVCYACEMGLGSGGCAEGSDYHKCGVCGDVADSIIKIMEEEND